MSTFYFKTKTIDFAVSTDNSVYLRNKVENTTEIYGDVANINISKFNEITLDNYIYECLEMISANSFVNHLFNLNYRDCIFVGAGLSKMSGIPDMNDLMEMFSLDDPKSLTTMIKKSPISLISKYKLFLMKTFVSKPNKAHLYLKEIQNKSNCKIITENIDDLLDKSDITYINLFRDLIDIKAPRKVILIGVGNPYFQSLLKTWESKGSVFLSVNLDRPNINVSRMLWCSSDISDIIDIATSK